MKSRPKKKGPCNIKKGEPLKKKRRKKRTKNGGGFPRAGVEVPVSHPQNGKGK